MKILVTGVAGFIGEQLTEHLLNQGHNVVGIDNFFDNNDIDIKCSRMAELGVDTNLLAETNEVAGRRGFRFVRQDVMDRDGLLALCAQEQFDAVFHLAAVTGSYFTRRAPAVVFDCNIYGTTNVLEAARLYGIKHVIFSSAAAVYNNGVPCPIAEDAPTDAPLSPYAASKRSAELICHAYARQFHIPVTIFRFFTVYGKWGRKDSVPMHAVKDILQGNEIKLLNNGYIIRDFTYIEDIVVPMTSSLHQMPQGKNGVPYEIFNIGRSKPVSLANFINAAATAMGKSANITMLPDSTLTIGEAPEIYADTTKLENVIAYSPEWEYEEAMPAFVEWYLANYKVTFDM